MPPDALNSAAALVDSVLTYQGITPATASADENAAALALANEAYREVCRGDYVDEQGREQHHIWSFLTLLDTTTMSFDSTTNPYAADLPTDFDGMVEPPLFPYSASAAGPGLNLQWVSPHEMARRQRDSDTAGTPEVYTIRPKAFTAAGGSTYQMLIDPPTDTDVVLQIRYRQLVALLTDSVNVFLRGPAGFYVLVLQCAKKNYELSRGQVNGPEFQRFMVQMRGFVRVDQEAYGDRDFPESFADGDSGLSV